MKSDIKWATTSKKAVKNNYINAPEENTKRLEKRIDKFKNRKFKMIDFLNSLKYERFENEKELNKTISKFAKRNVVMFQGSRHSYYQSNEFMFWGKFKYDWTFYDFEIYFAKELNSLIVTEVKFKILRYYINDIEVSEITYKQYMEKESKRWHFNKAFNYPSVYEMTRTGNMNINNIIFERKEYEQKNID